MGGQRPRPEGLRVRLGGEHGAGRAVAVQLADLRRGTGRDGGREEGTREVGQRRAGGRRGVGRGMPGNDRAPALCTPMTRSHIFHQLLLALLTGREGHAVSQGGVAGPSNSAGKSPPYHVSTRKVTSMPCEGGPGGKAPPTASAAHAPTTVIHAWSGYCACSCASSPLRGATSTHLWQRWVHRGRAVQRGSSKGCACEERFASQACVDAHTSSDRPARI